MKRFALTIAFAAIGLTAFAQSTTNKTPLLRGLLQGGLDANNQAITNGPASIGTNGTVYYGNAANLTNVPAPTAFGTPTTMSLTASNGFIDLGPTTNRPLWIGSGGTLTNGALNAGSGLTATTNNNSVSVAVTTNTYAVTANNLSDVTASTARANLGIDTNLYSRANETRGQTNTGPAAFNGVTATSMAITNLSGGPALHANTSNLTDFSSIVVEDFGGHFAGYDALSLGHTNELVLELSSTNIGYYRNNNVLQWNPRITDGSVGPLGFGMSYVSFPSGVQRIDNVLWVDGTNGFFEIFKSRKDGGGQTVINGGSVALYVDGTNGVQELQVVGTNAYNGPGTIAIDSSGHVTGSSTAFQTTFLNPKVFAVGGTLYHVVYIASDTSMYVAENTTQSAGTSYSVQSSGLSVYGPTGASKFLGTHFNDGELIINNSSHPGIWLTDWNSVREGWRLFHNDDHLAFWSYPNGAGAVELLNISDTATSGITVTSSGTLSVKALATTVSSFQAIAATGFTNATGSNGFAYVTGTAITYTNFDGAGNAYMTNTTLTGGTETIHMQAGAKFTAASGLSGTFHVE